MQTVIFEDDSTVNFRPITYTKPSFDIVLGGQPILDNIAHVLGKPDALIVQPHLKQVTQRRHPKSKVNVIEVGEETIFANGLLNPYSPELEKLVRRKGRFIAKSGGKVALCKVPPSLAQEILPPEGLHHKLSKIARSRGLEELTLRADSVIHQPWELIRLNPSWLSNQIVRSQVDDLSVDWRGVTVRGSSERIIVSENVVFEPPVLIDSKLGPVYVGEGSWIQAFTSIRGPAYLGRHCEVRSAHIGGSSIGDFCKVGGEVEESVIEEYTNKAHEGYVGHSYIGSWVNIGAGTYASNLKNTYGTIKMTTPSGRRDTGLVKLGVILADYSKTSIGSLIYAGTKLGVSSHLHGHMTKDIPSFTISAESLGAEPCELLLSSAIKTQERMMARRSVNQTKADIQLLRSVFDMTKKERREAGVSRGKFSL